MTDRRHKDDWYPTPPYATEALLAVEQFDEHVWECACGDGAISKVLVDAGHVVSSTDLNDFGYGTPGIDYLMETQLQADHIISNPPYKLANEFIKHSIELGVTKHCWLLRLAFLEGQKRFDDIFQHNPPARVYVFSKRLTIWRGDEDQAWYGSSGKTAYAWFCFEQGAAKTELSWL